MFLGRMHMKAKLLFNVTEMGQFITSKVKLCKSKNVHL